MLKAVIFDMDGTLGDTLALILRCFKETIEPLLGRDVSDEELMATFGPSEEATISALIPEHFDEGMDTYYRLYNAYHAEYSKPFDGIPEILRYIKEKNRLLGLVTGKGPTGTRITLDIYGMRNVFDAIETGIPEKPNKPACLKRMLERFGIEPHEAIYVGDAPGDIPAAGEAGVPVVSAAWASTAEPEKLKAMNPERTFGTVEAFADYIKSLLG